MQSTSTTLAETAFGRSFHEFNHVRTLPVTSPVLKRGLYVFSSEDSLLRYKTNNTDVVKGIGFPLFKAIQPTSLSFKKSSTIMTFYKYSSPSDKITYCRVFAKNMRDQYGVTRYILKFTPNGVEGADPSNFDVVIFSCTNAPINDCYYKGAKLRWIGSTLSEPIKSFKLLFLGKDTPSLCDGINMDTPLPNTEAKIDFNMTSTELPPLARFCENIPASKRGLVQTADMKVIEAFEGSSKDSVHDVAESSLVCVCMAMLLEEQRKNMGSSKSYDTTMFG
ncbi:hypothetical protein BON22_1375 [Cyberlindnera fabianii]|uniref:Uncharacterized protein n=1 Tax=Cyberlindnera fabianii TaxID=36022 RepID=A0A1V2LA41_CYBFA|nr:hypothetical protein BON22_1375 [Cyberlindnera fabianii]